MAERVELRPLPPEEAIAYFRQKGYRTTFSYLDMMHRAHSDAFTVAGVTRLDVLQDIRGLIDDALANGTTFSTFRKGMKEKLAAKGWWGPVEVSDPETGETKTVDLSTSRRLNTIFDTNMRVAYSAGEWQRIQRTKDALPYLVYETRDDGLVRPLHQRWNKVCMLVDHPWWKTHFPPCDWKCRCRTRQLTASRVKRLGLRVWDEPPDDGPPRKFVNRRTGEETMVPKGVHPSFAYNPGEQSSFPDPARYTGKAFGDEASRLAVRTDAFVDLVAGQKMGRAAPVAWIDDAISEAIDVVVKRVDLSSDVMALQATAHPQLTLAEYQQLPDLFSSGLAVRDGNEAIKLFGLLRDGEGILQLYTATAARSGNGQALGLMSFRRAERADLAGALSGQIIRDDPGLAALRQAAGGPGA